MTVMFICIRIHCISVYMCKCVSVCHVLDTCRYVDNIIRNPSRILYTISLCIYLGGETE